MVTAGIGTTVVSTVGKTAAHYILATLSGGISLLGELDNEQVTQEFAKMMLKNLASCQDARHKSITIVSRKKAV